MSIEEVFYSIIFNYGWIVAVMVAITSIILEAVKLPLKKLTGKIPNVTLRKIVNKVFILLGFGISVLLYYVGSVVLPEYVKYDYVRIFLTGSMSNVVYALAEGLISTNKAKSIINSIRRKTNDGNITKEEVVDMAIENTDSKELKDALKVWKEKVGK